MAAPSAEFAFMTVAEASRLMERREISSGELAGALLERAQRLNPRLNSYITIMADSAVAEARRNDGGAARRRRRGALQGIPVSLKDLIWTKGVLTTCGSRVLADHVPDYDATVVTRLKKAGAIILGKTHLQEFAMGGTGTDSCFGPARNPWNAAHLTGGSSSGSGAAVAAGTAMAALGTDTGGSVRIPACLCGIVGFKQTFGLVSRMGVMPLSWTMDHVGPMTRTVEDAVILLQAMVGPDPHDLSTTVARRRVPDYRAGLNGEIKGLRLGLIRELGAYKNDPDVDAAFRQALRVLEGLGCSVEEVSVPTIGQVSRFHPVISFSEAVAAHRPYYPRYRELYGKTAVTRLDLATLVRPSEYMLCQRARTVFCRDVAKAFQQVDLLVTPSCPVPAPRIDTKDVASYGELSRYTRPFNDCGAPAISVPCGFSRDGLPLGLQIAGRPFADDVVLRLAHAYEQATDWHTRRPEVGG
ncbi:MAG: amidase [Chloroflexi bacterium]|nr:amidase [Chloroflexota bacterium]